MLIVPPGSYLPCNIIVSPLASFFFFVKQGPGEKPVAPVAAAQASE
jgi:hypothetical protein